MGNRYLEIFVKQSGNFSQQITLTNPSTNTAMNLANLVITGSAKKSLYTSNISAVFTCTKANSANGFLIISLPQTETANMKAGRHFFDIVYTDTVNAAKDTIVEGIINVEKKIS